MKVYYKELFFDLNKTFAIYQMIKPIFEKDDFEKARKQANALPYVTYDLITAAILLPRSKAINGEIFWDNPKGNQKKR